MADITIGSDNLETFLSESVKSALDKKAETPLLTSLIKDVESKFAQKKGDIDTTASKRKTDLTDHLEKRRIALADETAPEREDIEDGYIFAGKIIDASDGEPLPFVRVRIKDLDRKDDDPLGVVTSDSNGNFKLFYTLEDFKDADAVPEIYVEVLDEKDKVIMRTDKSMLEKTPKNAWYEIAVDSEKLPEAIKKSKGILSNLTKTKAERLSKVATVTTLKKSDTSSIGSTAASLDPVERMKVSAAKSETTTSTSASTEKTLKDVAGLGKTYVKKLLDNRISTVESLASASTDTISKALNISGKKAEAIKSNARSLLK